MTPPHQDLSPDEQATVPGAVSRLASPSLPPSSPPPEIPNLTSRDEALHPKVEHSLTEEGTLDHAPQLPPAPIGRPWMIWAAVGLMTVAVLAALLLL